MSVPRATIVEAFSLGGTTGILWRKVSRKTHIGQCAGTRTANGYYQTQLAGHLYYNHRLVAVLCGLLDKYDRDLHIDHIDGNRTNNVPANLRSCTVRQNACNKQTHRNGKLPGCIEIHGRWRAQIKVANKMVYLGTYASMEEANAKYSQFKEANNLI